MVSKHINSYYSCSPKTLPSLGPGVHVHMSPAAGARAPRSSRKARSFPNLPRSCTPQGPEQRTAQPQPQVEGREGFYNRSSSSVARCVQQSARREGKGAGRAGWWASTVSRRSAGSLA